MRAWLDPQGLLNIDTGLINLAGGEAVVNGVAVAGAAHEPTPGADGWLRVRWRATALEAAAFGVELMAAGRDEIRLRYWLEDWPADLALDSFGLRFGALENARAGLRSGYYSWDGSEYWPLHGEPGAAEGDVGTAVGYGLTQLLPRTGQGSLVVGFERHDRFQQAFTLERSPASAALTVLTLWDRRAPDGTGRRESEWLVIFTHPAVEAALRRWAHLVAQAAPTPPRLAGPPITGWCSWYNLYSAITEDNIRHHLRQAAVVAQRERLPLRVFQIDDGYTPELGDWLEVRPQFPRGLAPLLAEIRAAGFVPGLWIAPFMVGNRSRLFQEHPDWMVGDRQTGGPLVVMRFYGEFRLSKRSEEY